MKKRSRQIIAGVVTLVVLAMLARGSFRSGRSEAATAEVIRGSIQVWTSHEGFLESRTVRNIMSRLGGPATIVELAPEGGPVNEGELLVRFDATVLERELLRLQRDYKLAKADLDGLENAKLPLELRDLEMRLLQARSDLASEEQFLVDSRELLKEGLVAEAEVRQQDQKVSSLRTQAENLGEQLRLTREYLHPSQLERARATLATAEQEMQVAEQQVKDCAIMAPSAGIVAYKPLSVGGEYRTARVGDSVFKNQPFMTLPDMTDLVVHIDVPESELAAIGVGQRVVVLPAAYPGLRLKGRVESVGSMAQSRMDRPQWQKYFHVVVGLDESNPALRTGMSVLCNVLTHEQADAVLVPRTCVMWEQDEAYCRVWKKGKVEDRRIKVGPADEQRFAVLEGLKPGERVVIE